MFYQEMSSESVLGLLACLALAPNSLWGVMVGPASAPGFQEGGLKFLPSQLALTFTFCSIFALFNLQTTLCLYPGVTPNIDFSLSL